MNSEARQIRIGKGLRSLAELFAVYSGGQDVPETKRITIDFHLVDTEKKDYRRNKGTLGDGLSELREIDGHLILFVIYGYGDWLAFTDFQGFSFRRPIVYKRLVFDGRLDACPLYSVHDLLIDYGNNRVELNADLIRIQSPPSGDPIIF